MELNLIDKTLENIDKILENNKDKITKSITKHKNSIVFIFKL